MAYKDLGVTLVSDGEWFFSPLVKGRASVREGIQAAFYFISGLLLEIF